MPFDFGLSVRSSLVSLRRVKAWVIGRFGRIFRFSGIVSKFCKTSELGVKNYVKPPLLH